MPYDLMLLADPGPERARVVQVLQDAPDTRPDPTLGNRFWLTTLHGEAQVNLGTKDPVESVHLEFDAAQPALLEAIARRALELATTLDMRVEDVQWGHEVTTENLPRLLEHCSRQAAPTTSTAATAPRPWWRFW